MENKKIQIKYEIEIDDYSDTVRYVINSIIRVINNKNYEYVDGIVYFSEDADGLIKDLYDKFDGHYIDYLVESNGDRLVDIDDGLYRYENILNAAIRFIDSKAPKLVIANGWSYIDICKQTMVNHNNIITTQVVGYGYTIIDIGKYTEDDTFKEETMKIIDKLNKRLQKNWNK